jgi:TnpA family transposase
VSSKHQCATELNKLEHTNKVAKAVFLDNNHEFRPETREEQLIRVVP